MQNFAGLMLFNYPPDFWRLNAGNLSQKMNLLVELAHKTFYHITFGHNRPEEFFGMAVNEDISSFTREAGK